MTESPKLHLTDLVLVVTAQEAEQMARSEECGIMYENMPRWPKATVYGIPDRLYGIYVKVRDGEKLHRVLVNGDVLC